MYMGRIIPILRAIFFYKKLNTIMLSPTQVLINVDS